MVLARKCVARGSQRPKTSTESHRRTMRYLRVLGDFFPLLFFFSKGINGLILLRATKWGILGKQGEIMKTNTPALKYKLNISEKEENNYRKGFY